tara:strand:- start:1084 stop:2253 length:1170 start_codon:yes stop_codon:yes gene_type:complete
MANLNWWEKFSKPFSEAYGEGRDDHRQAFYNAREDKGQDIDAPRIETTLGTNPSITRTRDYLGISNPADRAARAEMGMGTEKGRTAAIAQILGTLAADVTQDHSRSLWWLLNAPQATANVATEIVLNRANPDLYKAEPYIVPSGSKKGQTVKFKDKELAERQKLIVDAESGRRKKGIGVSQGKPSSRVYTKRKYAPGAVAALSIPTGLAINTGLGLMTPFGGAEGYEAAVPSELDKSKTDNVIAEVAAKYILGRTGNLLPYDEFRKVRPDVSKGDYNRYKAFKYDKEVDLNPLDGDVTLPAGVMKLTTEGIHGPEMQFLGRSMPLTTAGIPFATALAGTAMGVRRGRPIRGGLVGGIGGFMAGQLGGNLAEQGRRTIGGIDPEGEYNYY